MHERALSGQRLSRWKVLAFKPPVQRTCRQQTSAVHHSGLPPTPHCCAGIPCTTTQMLGLASSPSTSQAASVSVVASLSGTGLFALLNAAYFNGFGTDQPAVTCRVCGGDARFLRSATRPDYETATPRLRVVDLFAGEGGLSLGIAEAARRVGKGRGHPRGGAVPWCCKGVSRGTHDSPALERTPVIWGGVLAGRG